MNKPPLQLKPIAAFVSELDEQMKERWTLPITLHPTYVDEGLAILSGSLVSSAGRFIEQITFSCHPDSLPKPRPVGAPRKDEKHLAVFLAWALEVVLQRGKVTNADQEVSLRMNYEPTGRMVSRIRRKIAERFSFDTVSMEFLWHADDGPNHPTAVGMIPKPQFTIYGDGLQVVGSGYAWNPSLGDKVMQGYMTAESSSWPAGFGPADLEILNSNKRTLIIVH